MLIVCWKLEVLAKPEIYIYTQETNFEMQRKRKSVFKFKVDKCEASLEDASLEAMLVQNYDQPTDRDKV